MTPITSPQPLSPEPVLSPPSVPFPIQPRHEISYHRPVSSSWSSSEIHDELAYPEQDRDQGLRSQAQEGFAGDLHVRDGGLKEVYR